MKSLLYIKSGGIIMNKKDLKNIWLILFLFIAILAFLLNSKYLFGNSLNYYKELDILSILKSNYLNTKKVLPTFINERGISYNIYNYVRYGLLNPFIIITYFININLSGYYSVLGVISLGIGIILLYKFLYSMKYDRYTILITVFFVMVSANIYKIMFNSILDMLVFPFLVLAFIGAKKRLDSNKGMPLCLSIFIISIVNYMYLPSIIICLLVYSLYYYYINNKKFLLKKWFWFFLSFIVPILAGLLMGSIALVPVIDNIEINILDMIRINYDINIVIVFSVLFGIFSNKRNRILSIIMLLFLLLFKNNYLSYLVLLSVMVGNFVEGIIKAKINNKVIVLGILISFMYLIVNINYIIFVIVWLFSMFLYKDTKNKKCLLIVLAFTFIYTWYDVSDIELYNKDFINSFEYNVNDYNTLYQMLMGNNISDKNIIGFRKNMDKNGKVFYKNDDVLYRGYATNSIMSYEDYEQLNGLAKQEVMLSTIVTDSHSKNEYVSYVDEVKIPMDHYDIKVNNNTKFVYKLNKVDWNKIMYIEFSASSNNCDGGSIKINNVVKYIDCKEEQYSYTISDNNLKELVINISEGNYKIKNIKIYSLDYGRILNNKMSLDEFFVKNDNGRISGDIQVAGDGYFVINIPYNHGYEIRIDGEIVKYEKVNVDYIGVPIIKGKHSITINYDIKYRLMSVFFSYLGLVFMLLVNYLEKKRKFT